MYTCVHVHLCSFSSSNKPYTQYGLEYRTKQTSTLTTGHRLAVLFIAVISAIIVVVTSEGGIDTVVIGAVKLGGQAGVCNKPWQLL